MFQRLKWLLNFSNWTFFKRKFALNSGTLDSWNFKVLSLDSSLKCCGFTITGECSLWSQQFVGYLPPKIPNLVHVPSSWKWFLFTSTAPGSGLLERATHSCARSGWRGVQVCSRSMGAGPRRAHMRSRAVCSRAADPAVGWMPVHSRAVCSLARGTVTSLVQIAVLHWAKLPHGCKNSFEQQVWLQRSKGKRKGKVHEGTMEGNGSGDANRNGRMESIMDRGRQKAFSVANFPYYASWNICAIFCTHVDVWSPCIQEYHKCSTLDKFAFFETWRTDFPTSRKGPDAPAELCPDWSPDACGRLSEIQLTGYLWTLHAVTIQSIFLVIRWGAVCVRSPMQFSCL